MTLSAETLITAAAAGTLAGGGAFLLANARSLATRAWAAARARLAPAPDLVVDLSGRSELLEIRAAVHRAQVRALDAPAPARTDALAECDRFLAALERLYAEGP